MPGGERLLAFAPGCGCLHLLPEGVALAVLTQAACAAGGGWGRLQKLGEVLKCFAPDAGGFACRGRRVIAGEKIQFLPRGRRAVEQPFGEKLDQFFKQGGIFDSETAEGTAVQIAVRVGVIFEGKSGEKGGDGQVGAVEEVAMDIDHRPLGGPGRKVVPSWGTAGHDRGRQRTAAEFQGIAAGEREHRGLRSVGQWDAVYCKMCRKDSWRARVGPGHEFSAKIRGGWLVLR